MTPLVGPARRSCPSSLRPSYRPYRRASVRRTARGRAAVRGASGVPPSWCLRWWCVVVRRWWCAVRRPARWRWCRRIVPPLVWRSSGPGYAPGSGPCVGPGSWPGCPGRRRRTPFPGCPLVPGTGRWVRSRELILLRARLQLQVEVPWRPVPCSATSLLRPDLRAVGPPLIRAWAEGAVQATCGARVRVWPYKTTGASRGVAGEPGRLVPPPPCRSCPRGGPDRRPAPPAGCRLDDALRIEVVVRRTPG